MAVVGSAGGARRGTFSFYQICLQSRAQDGLTDKRDRRLLSQYYFLHLEMQRAAEINQRLSYKTRPLTEEEEERVTAALHRHEDHVLAEGFNIQIHARDAQCLQPGSWLNDEVINFFMEMVAARSQRWIAEGRRGALRVFCHNSFFYNRVTSESTGYNYNSVKRWSMRKKKKIIEQDLVMFPVNVNQNHWCLAVINFNQKRFEYYDSLQGENRLCLNAMRNYVKNEAKQCSGIEKYDLSGWTDYVPDDIPRQKNGCDCGVFTLQFADYLSEGLPLSPAPFTQDDMPIFRQRILLSILDGRLD